MIDAALACGRADHETWMNELTPTEWNWLEAYRGEYGLPEDRLRYYLAIMTSCITAAVSLTGNGLSADKVLKMMDPFRDGPDRSDGVEIVSPKQGAAMFAANMNAAKSRVQRG